MKKNIYNENMAKKKSTTQKAVNKAYKANPKAFIISVVAIVLVIAIAMAIVYFAFPDTWNNIADIIQGYGDVDDNGSGGGSNNGGGSSSTLTQGEGELLVHMINVGQGDCIYIQFPDGDDMVIDAGSTSKPKNNASFSVDTILAYLGSYIKDGTIEHLMLTHTDEDHVSYLDDIVDAYQVKNIYMPYVLAAPDVDKLSAKVKAEFESIPADKKNMFKDKDTITTAKYAEFFAAALNEENCNIFINMDDDDRHNNILIEDSANTYEFRFYCPTKEYYENSSLGGGERKNAVSPVGILTYNGRKIMFTGDSNEINEPLVVNRTGKIDCDVLKVGHHGSETSTTQNFLDAYTFEYALISCGLHTSYYHPRQDALDRLEDIMVYRTDNNGNIVLSVDKDGNLSFKPQYEATQEDNHYGYLDINGNQRPKTTATNYLSALFFETKRTYA